MFLFGGGGWSRLFEGAEKRAHISFLIAVEMRVVG